VNTFLVENIPSHGKCSRQQHGIQQNWIIKLRPKYGVEVVESHFVIETKDWLKS
jgi:hypothetical protein